MMLNLSLIQIASIAILIISVFFLIKSIGMPINFYENQNKRKKMILEKLRQMDEVTDEENDENEETE